MSHRSMTLNSKTDEIVLAGPKDRPSVTYLYSTNGGGVFYVYRPAQAAYGQRLRELRAVVSREEVQRAIDERAQYERISEYADVARLRDLGFRITGHDDDYAHH